MALWCWCWFFACLLITSLRTNEGIKDDTAEFSTNMFHTFQRSSRNYCAKKQTKRRLISYVFKPMTNYFIARGNTLCFEKHNGFYDKRKRKVGARGIFENQLVNKQLFMYREEWALPASLKVCHLSISELPLLRVRCNNLYVLSDWKTVAICRKIASWQR